MTYFQCRRTDRKSWFPVPWTNFDVPISIIVNFLFYFTDQLIITVCVIDITHFNFRNVQHICRLHCVGVHNMQITQIFNIAEIFRLWIRYWDKFQHAIKTSIRLNHVKLYRNQYFFEGLTTFKNHILKIMTKRKYLNF